MTSSDKSSCSNNEESQDYLATKIHKLLSEYELRRLDRESKLSQAVQNGVHAIASFAANETELQRQFKTVDEDLNDEIESLEEGLKQRKDLELEGNSTNSWDVRLSVYRKIRPALSAALVSLTKDMYQSRFRYLELKTQRMSDSELQEEAKLWSERCINIEKYGPEMRDYTLKCKDLCERELAKHRI